MKKSQIKISKNNRLATTKDWTKPYEATSIRDDEPYLADVLVKLKLIEPLWEGGTTESDAICWLEKEPPLKDKLRVLEEMGYDLSILKLEK